MENNIKTPKYSDPESKKPYLSEHKLAMTRLRFNISVQQDQIVKFRSLINMFIGGEDNRFHNHISARAYN